MKTKTAIDEDIKNIAFLRTQIELIEYCFSKNEIDEIWITFPDPQLKYKRNNYTGKKDVFRSRRINLEASQGFKQ